MTNPTNKDKDLKLDEAILEEIPPNINEPQEKEEIPTEKLEEEESKKVVEEDGKVEEKEELSKETSEQKEKRYKAQQTEVQIQAAKNRSLLDKVDQASKIGEPNIEELKAFVGAEGVNWDELTTFEQAMAKKSYLSEKRFDLVNDALQFTKKIDEWATKVDTFIDSIEDDPKYIKLSGNEAEFRKFCMKEAHRGAPIEVLLGSFLYNLPKPQKKQGSIFESGGGGEKIEKPGKLTDVDAIALLREKDPREYKRQLKLGNIIPEI